MADTFSAITGASGLLGGYLAERLAADGRKVRALVRPTSNTTLLKALGIELVVGDVTDRSAVVAAVRGADVVYHCGAKTDNWGPWREYLAVNVQGTRNVVEACQRHGVGRLVHISSIAVYGHPRLRCGQRIDDDAALGQRLWLGDHYNRSKIEAERLVRESRQQAVILRPTWLYGPRDLTVIPTLYRVVQKGGARLIGSCDRPLNMIYASDAAEAAVLAAGADVAVGQCYNICTDGDLTQRELVDMLCEATGRPRVRRRIPHGVAHLLGFACEGWGKFLRKNKAPPLTRHGISVFLRPAVFSAEKARRELGWAPRGEAGQKVALTLRWLQGQGAPHDPTRL